MLPGNEKILISNEAGIVHFRENTASISSASADQQMLELYPAISKSEVFINNNNPENLKVNIYNARGTISRTCMIRPGENRLDISRLPAGLYFARPVELIAQPLKFEKLN